MKIASIGFTDFRCFTQFTLDLHPEVTTIIGENAKGKTSILEGVYTVMYGKGFRESREIELIRKGTVQCLLQADLTGTDDTAVHCNMRIIAAGQSRVSKSYSLQKSKVTFRGYRQHGLHAVLFAPQHINIIVGSPSRRREYIDHTLSTLDLAYSRHLRTYQNALRSRNKLLEYAFDSPTIFAELEYWDGLMMTHSRPITEARIRYCDGLNAAPQLDGKSFKIRYVPDEFTLEKLRDFRRRELAARKTLMGPQRDEYVVHQENAGDEDVRIYGSRSQQRMAVLWMKLFELQECEVRTGVRPVLLLDDIYSELDKHNRALVTSIAGVYQTIVTTTEDEIVQLLGGRGAEVRL